MLSESPSEMSTKEWRSVSSFRSSNLKELDEPTIRQLLDTFQGKLFKTRGGAKSILVVHGGVVSVLLHKNRQTTTDIDYIGRTVYDEVVENEAEKTDESSIKKDWRKFFARLHGRGGLGPDEMNLIIRVCVEETTLEFNADFRRSGKLKLDWMNCAADVALPWSLDENNQLHDPLVHSVINNPFARTVFDSPGLKLISLPWPWLLALKLQRFTINDQADIVAILQYENLINGLYYSSVVSEIEGVLRRECPVMDYDHFPQLMLTEWRMRIYDCVKRASFGGRKDEQPAEPMSFVALND